MQESAKRPSTRMEQNAEQESGAAAPLVIGVTSHRDIPAHEAGTIRQRVRNFFAWLQREFPHSPLCVLSPLAEGGDQLVAEEGLGLGAQLIAPLPFARALYAQDFTEAASRERFDALCAQAKLIELPLLAGHTEQRIARHGRERDLQYLQAGMFVARHCHLLLAIWDGKDSGGLGGTAQIVDYYLTGTLAGALERRERPRRWLLEGGEERLLCHMVCSRDARDGAPAGSLQSGEIIWRTSDSIGEPGAPMPPAFRRVFAHTDEFNLDASKYRDRIAASRVESDEPDGTQDGGAVAALFAIADWLAMRFQKRVLLGLRIIYTAAALMGIAFAIYGNLPHQERMLYVFLFLLAVGIVTSFVAKRRAWHRKYLDYRALAEGLRVQSYWRRAGISLTTDPEFARESLMQKQDIELGWVRNAMRSVGLAGSAYSAQPDQAQLRGVIADWVGDESEGELGYYRRRTEQRERAHRLNQTISAICLAAAIVISAVMVALLHRLSFDARNGLIVSIAVLSIAAAVREAYSFRKADRELIRQYQFMGRVFGDARRALERTEDVEEQREILRALGEAALAEHVEWAIMHRDRPLEAGRM